MLLKEEAMGQAYMIPRYLGQVSALAVLVAPSKIPVHTHVPNLPDPAPTRTTAAARSPPRRRPELAPPPPHAAAKSSPCPLHTPPHLPFPRAASSLSALLLPLASLLSGRAAAGPERLDAVRSQPHAAAAQHRILQLRLSPAASPSGTLAGPSAAGDGSPATRLATTNLVGRRPPRASGRFRLLGGGDSRVRRFSGLAARSRPPLLIREAVDATELKAGRPAAGRLPRPRPRAASRCSCYRPSSVGSLQGCGGFWCRKSKSWATPASLSSCNLTNLHGSLEVMLSRNLKQVSQSRRDLIADAKGSEMENKIVCTDQPRRGSRGDGHNSPLTLPRWGQQRP